LQRESSTYDLPDDEFIAKARQRNAALDQLLSEPELREIFIPILRADFGAYETYVYRKEAPLDCGITAFGGLEDDRVKVGQLKAWSAQTIRGFSLQMFAGDHLFLNREDGELLRAVSSRVQQTELPA
jgi:medium-chain acyl-[acyl-carrier-protein] hydrolase